MVVDSAGVVEFMVNNESDSVESVDKEGSIVEVEVEVDELDMVDVGVVTVDDEGVVDVKLAG